MTEHEHEWQTRYTKRPYADGVEWFCASCGISLDWPTAKKWVNEHAALKRKNERLMVVARAYRDKVDVEHSASGCSLCSCEGQTPCSQWITDALADTQESG